MGFIEGVEETGRPSGDKRKKAAEVLEICMGRQEGKIATAVDIMASAVGSASFSLEKRYIYLSEKEDAKFILRLMKEVGASDIISETRHMLARMKQSLELEDREKSVGTLSPSRAAAG